MMTFHYRAGALPLRPAGGGAPSPPFILEPVARSGVGKAEPAGRRRHFSPPSVELAPAERILWQITPDWRAIATRVFHIRAAAAYFTLLTLIDIGIMRNAEGPGLLALKGGEATAITGLVCVGILAFLAFAVGRTTRYTLTTRRVIMQFGIALPATLMLPLHKIAQCNVAIHPDHSGDIAMRLFPGEQIPYIKLWPHARPWRLRTPQPMLRDIPRAAVAATQLMHALAAGAQAKRAMERDQERDPAIGPRPAPAEAAPPPAAPPHAAPLAAAPLAAAAQ